MVSSGILKSTRGTFLYEIITFYRLGVLISKTVCLGGPERVMKGKAMPMSGLALK